MKDIAERAGVSLSTVSHVYSGKRTISEPVKRQVQKIAAEMGYRPNLVAKSLATKKTNVIGLYLSSQSVQDAPFFSILLKGLTLVANNEHYRFLLNVRESEHNEETYYDEIHKGDVVDGVIITDPRIGDMQIEQIQKRDIPFVVIGRPSKQFSIPYVDTDNEDVGYCATNHLINLGHRKIAFINGPKDYTVSKDRLLGYRRALLEAGVPYIDDLVIFSDDFFQNCGAESASRLMKLGLKFTAVFVAADNLAVGAMKYFQLQGMKVPEEVGIVAVNNSLISETINPSLTVIDILTEEIGAAAAQLIIDKIEGKEIVYPKIIGHNLIVRQSCGAS